MEGGYSSELKQIAAAAAAVAWRGACTGSPSKGLLVIFTLAPTHFPFLPSTDHFWKGSTTPGNYKAIPDGGVALHHLLRFRLNHMI